MKVYEILEATKGILVSGNKEDDICFFSQDSRQMKNGGMYIPLKGERFDGHDFIESAFQTGATAIITAKDVSYPDKIVIKVEDTYQALKDMAIYLRSHRPVKVVGVTGSVGKTSTRDMVYSVVKQKYKTLKTEGNYNNEIGLPLTILRYQDEEVTYTDMLVPLSIELSTSDYTLFQERKSVLTDLGFKIEDFGINTICIKSHPTWLRENYEQDNIKYIVDLVLENKNFNKDRFLDSLAKMVSCKMSVKANEHLSLEQMEKLLNDLVKCDNPYNCCHGRPSIMKFSNYELEKMFRRVL